MERSTALESARTKRPGDPEGNPEVALRGGIKNKRAALGVIKGENGTAKSKAGGKRVTRSQSRTKTSSATDESGEVEGAAEDSADTTDAPAGEADTVVGAIGGGGSMDVDVALQNTAAAKGDGGGGAATVTAADTAAAAAAIGAGAGAGAAVAATTDGGAGAAVTDGTAAAAAAAVVLAGTGHVNIDAGQSDPHVVVEYVDEIYTYLRGLENKFRPKPGYMKKQRDINHGMRTILVDWLVEVAEEYKLNSHTLYIAVGYIDRFLSEMSVNRGKLQLVGVTSMLLASKYEEIYPPAVDEFVYITDNTYTRDQILKMENLVLKVLQFDMGAVTAYSFAERFLKAAEADDRTRHLTQYLMELTLQDGERYLKYRPSVVAAAAVCVTLDTLQLPCWTVTLQHYTELQPSDIVGCVRDVFLTFCSADKVQQQAVREKYGEDKFMHVSRLCPAQNAPDFEDVKKA